MLRTVKLQAKRNVGTPAAHGSMLWGKAITVQQKLMRHSDFQTTLNIYGDVVTNEMQQAGSKIAELALRSDSRVIPSVVSH
jgi:integrase